MTAAVQFVAAWLRARRGDDAGASLVEYALLIALILLVCVLAVTLLGQSVSSKFDSVGNSLSN